MPDSDALLRRRPAAAALTDAGYPTACATLATLASRGGGPVYRRYGRYPLYRWGDLLIWAEARLGPAVTSTSEADAASVVSDHQRAGRARISPPA